MQSATAARTGAPSSSLATAMAALIERFAARIRMDAELDRLVLPSMPDSVVAVRKVMKDPDSAIEDVCRAIARDPTLATRVLRIANSPAFVGVSPCTTLNAAVIRLGPAVIDNVMLVLAVARVFSVGKRAQIQPHIARLWTHSTRVAALSEALAARTTHLQRDVAVLAGLVHDIGVLPLLVRAQEFPTLFANPVLLAHLLATLHEEVGALVVESWNAPHVILQAVTEHEHLERDQPGPPDYADLVLVANHISHLEPAAGDSADEPWTLPAFRKFDLDHEAVPELLVEADGCESALRAGVQAD